MKKMSVENRELTLANERTIAMRLFRNYNYYLNVRVGMSSERNQQKYLIMIHKFQMRYL